MTPPFRVALAVDSDDETAWPLGFQALDFLGSTAERPVTDYVLLTHTKHQLQHTTLSSAMGEAVAKALLAGRSVRLPSGGQLRHATLQTLGGSARDAAILAFYADDRMLETVDAIREVGLIVAVAEYPGTIANWIKRWNPAVPGQAPAAPATLLSDPVVERALTYLTGGINLSHASLNPRDKENADQTLRILRAKGHTLDPQGIKSWAIRAGWIPTAAEELGKLAGRIAGLKTKPSISSIRAGQSRYDAWSE